MVITNYAKSLVAFMLGSQINNQYIQTYAFGAGSQTLVGNLTTLTGSEFGRVMITGSPNFSSPQVVIFTGDLNSAQASGLILKQFGLFTSGPINTGSVYNLNQLNGSIVCDGTIELSFESAIQVL